MAVEWHQANGTMELAVLVPPGTTATVELPLHPTNDSHRVGAGEHGWAYPLHHRMRELTLDTPIEVLAADDATWARITTILGHHLPRVSLDVLVERQAAIPLSTVLDDFSALSAGAREELASAIEAYNVSGA